MLYIIPGILLIILITILVLIWTRKNLKNSHKIILTIVTLILLTLVTFGAAKIIKKQPKSINNKQVKEKKIKNNNKKQPTVAPKPTMTGITNTNKLANKQSKLMLEHTGIKWSPELKKQLKNVDFSKYNFDTKNPKLITDVNDLLVLTNKANYLPKNFIPINLINPKSRYRGGGNRNRLRKVAADSLDKLVYQANSQGINIKNVSAYRSIQYQVGLFNSYAKRHGIEAANKFSSKPQFSEHHTGLCADVSSPSMSWGLGKNYINTTEGKWLAQNAHKFGFIIRYPNNKYSIVGYNYEPWHIRYLGIPLATYLHQTNLTFEEFLALQVGKTPEEIKIK